MRMSRPMRSQPVSQTAPQPSRTGSGLMPRIQRPIAGSSAATGNPNIPVLPGMQRNVPQLNNTASMPNTFDVLQKQMRGTPMKKGGKVKASSASKRADGCAQRGKTRGKFV